MSINNVALLIFLSVSAGTDLCDGRIYNRWTAAGCTAALFLCGISDVSRLPDRLLGAAVPLLLLLFFFRIGVIGGGDVKLLMMTGCFLGSGGVLKCMFAALLTAAGFSLGRMLADGSLKRRLRGLFSYAKNSMRARRLQVYESAVPKAAALHLSVFVMIGAWMYMEGLL